MTQEYKNLEGAVNALKPKAVLVDLWGVVHDGKNTYAGALDTLEKLKESGIEIVILSNAPDRADDVASHLDKFGMEKGKHFDSVASSGEVAYEYFSKNNQPQKYFLIGKRDLLESLEQYEQVDSPEKADFVIADGFDKRDEKASVKKYKEELSECAKHNLNMFCLNPDIYTMEISGEWNLKAGDLAHNYKNSLRDAGLKEEEIEQKVKYFGKPEMEIYEMALELAGADKSEIVMIGDSPVTDIMGANRFGIKSIMPVNSGTIGGMLRADPYSDELPSQEVLENLTAIQTEKPAEQSMPTAIIPRFAWNEEIQKKTGVGKESWKEKAVEAASGIVNSGEQKTALPPIAQVTSRPEKTRG